MPESDLKASPYLFIITVITGFSSILSCYCPASSQDYSFFVRQKGQMLVYLVYHTKLFLSFTEISLQESLMEWPVNEGWPECAYAHL